LDQILEEQEDDVTEQPRPFAEVLMLKDVEDLSNECIKVLIVHKDITNGTILQLC
jgi:hypothetical protein